MSLEHKRPLLAFILIALVCGVVIGHALATQAMPAMPALLVGPVDAVEGLVFEPAAADEVAGRTFAVVPAAGSPADVAPQGVAAVSTATRASYRPTRVVGTHAQAARASHPVAAARWQTWTGWIQRGNAHARGGARTTAAFRAAGPLTRHDASHGPFLRPSHRQGHTVSHVR